MKKAWLPLLFGTALVLGACGGGGDNATSDNGGGASTGGSDVDGEKIVMETCTTCHGGQLQGMGNTPALSDVGSRLSEEEILDVIQNGRTDKGMPGGLLQGEKAEAAAAWLAQQK